MSVNNGIITAPVSLADVNKALGSNHTTVDAACVDAHINIWAKYKPVKLAVPFTTDQYDFSNNKWKDNANWFQGFDGAVCGLLPYKTSVFADIITNTTGGMNGWTYQRPTGGEASPYRLQDFAGYNHNAPAAVGFFGGTTKTANAKEFTASAAISPGGNDCVALKDFRTQMYFGVAICNSNGGVVYHGTSSNTGTAFVSFTVTGLQQTTYKVVPFLCGDQITPTVGSFAAQHTFWTVPNVSIYNLTVTAATALTGIVATGTWVDAKHTRLSIEVKNTGKATQTGAIYVRRIGRKWDSAQYADEYTSSSLTFAAGATTTQTVTGLSTSYNYHAQVRLVSGELFEVGIMDGMQIQL